MISEGKMIIKNYLKSKIVLILWLLLTILLNGFLQMYPINYMQKIIDNVVLKSPFTKIIYLIFMWYLLRILSSVSTFIAGYFSGKLSAELGGELRNKIFLRIAESDYKSILNGSSAEIVMRTIDDTSDIGRKIIKPVYSIIDNLFIFIWASIFLARIDLTLLIACIPIGFLMLYLGSVVSKKNKNIIRQRKEHQEKLIQTMLESISFARDLLIFNSWGRQTKEYDDQNEGVITTEISSTLLLNMLDSILEFLWPIATVVSLSLGSYRVLTESLSLGGLISFMWYIQWVIHPISQIANYRVSLQSITVSIDRVDELFKVFNSSFFPTHIINDFNCLELKDVSFAYSKDKVIDSINLKINTCSNIAIVGKTGCGKSTVLKLILGLFPQLNGKILIDNKVVNYEELCGSPFIAAAFQEPYIFKDSISHNIALDDIIDIDLMNKCITVAELVSTIETLPSGLNAIVGEGIRELSTGQMQRIGIARALYKKPKLLVLDEATASIDSSTEEKILRNIKDVFPNISIITVSHRLSSIKNCDHIIYIDDGRIISEGTHSELVKSCIGYMKMYTSQMQI